MLSKKQTKLISSLHKKKYRILHNLFFVEGKKAILEFLNNDLYLLEYIYSTKKLNFLNSKIEIITKGELKKISALKNPNQMLAIFQMPKLQPKKPSKGITLVLDNIQDPGNLGTIIRLCDWFGVTNLVCSKNTVDCYNPKVIQASMGSLARVIIKYTNLHKFLTGCKLPIYGSLLNGENIYKSKLTKDCIIVMGNEGQGISDNIIDLCTNKITIPKFGKLKQTESLNVATSTAIILSEFVKS